MSSTSSIAPSPTRWRSIPTSRTPSSNSPAIPAEALLAVREPARWMLDLGPRRAVCDLMPAFGRAASGVEPLAWSPPEWLHPHQRAAALRLAGALDLFGGALLADAAGLGKTHVALALAARASSAVAVVPATLRSQWRRTSGGLGVPVRIVTHEALSRRGRVPPAGLIIVDEAHRFRNPATRRYDRLARDARGAQLLLVTATPVVNRAADLHHLLRLFLPDHALAILGVRSLDRALAAGRFAEVLHGAAPLIVARTPQTAGRLPGTLPSPADATIVDAPPAAPRDLDRIVCAVDRLRFPGFDAESPALLRRHLLYRLASSVEAAAETARRHRAYCMRARDAALRGEPLPRGVARRVFGDDDDGQLELLLLNGTRTANDPRDLDAETRRLNGLLAALGTVRRRPKEDALGAVLFDRHGRKTLVFTAARATALRLADSLGWRRVGVVTGAGARIASGRIVAEEAFALFAPAAHDRDAPAATLRIDVLIATDLASEGLNLQDADAVVHFDLPWTPVRLAQRIGRIVRLGSRHRHVDVCWFVPPRGLEAQLALVARLRSKLGVQLELAVPSSSAVGRASVTSATLEARERIVRHTAAATTGHAVAAGAFDVLALRWTAGAATVRELVGLSEGTVVLDPKALERELAQGARAEPDGAGARERAVGAVAAVVRERLAAAAAGPCDIASRRLSRRILRRARTAAAARQRALVDLLDQALARLHGGLTVGEERTLSAVLDARRPADGLRHWVGRTPLRSRDWDGCAVEAALLATGPTGDACPD